MKNGVLMIAALLATGGALLGQQGGMGMMGRGRMGGMGVMSWMAGAEIDGMPTAPMPEVTERLRADGSKVYSSRCTPCHGVDGNGRGPESHRLSVPPTDFTRGTFKFRSTPSGQPPTYTDVFRTISRGVHGTAMLPWTWWLSERERWAAAAYVRDDLAQTAEAAPASVELPGPPETTGALLAQGRDLYVELKCSDCHGLGGRGDGPRSDELKDSLERPIRPRDFTMGRLKAGSLPEDLYRTIATGLDGTPMASFDLGPEYVWPLVFYVRSLIPEKPKPATRNRWGRGMMGMRGSGMHPEEQLGMMIDMPGMRGMGRGMMRR